MYLILTFTVTLALVPYFFLLTYICSHFLQRSWEFIFPQSEQLEVQMT